MRLLKLAPLFAACATIGGCLSSLPIDNSSAAGGADRTLGSVELHSAQFGQAIIAPDTCRSGDRERFLGGDFVDTRSGLVVRLVFDPLDGAALRIFASDAQTEKSAVFRRGDCRTLKYDFAPTSWRVNDIDDFRISMTFECAAHGDAAKGTVSSTHCH